MSDNNPQKPIPDSQPATVKPAQPQQQVSDADKTTEQLQREVLLLQKKQLEKEAQAKPVTFGTIVGATLVAWIIIGVVGGIVAAIGFSFMMYDIQEQRDQEQPDVYLEVQHPCWSCNSNSSSANASAGVR